MFILKKGHQPGVYVPLRALFLVITQVCLFCFDYGLTPDKQFFSHVETEPPIPGYYQYFWEVNVSCSRKQHTDLAEDQTRVSRSAARRSKH